MKEVFADTSYWIALLHSGDEHHEKAIEVSDSLGQYRIVTSEMVLAELLNYFAKYPGELRARAWQTAQEILNDPNVVVIPQSSRQFREALNSYWDRPDKQWSMTDCASFRIMKERGIQDSLTADRHFQQAGFKALLLDD